MTDHLLWVAISTHLLILSNPILLGFLFIRLGRLTQRLASMEGRITHMEHVVWSLQQS